MERVHFIETAELEKEQVLPFDERCLTEVDNLNRHRLPNGKHAPWAIQEITKNIVSAVKESSIPNAVNTEEHEYLETDEIDASGESIGTFMWLGMTAVEHALSGKRYHTLPAALQRVEVEADEARFKQLPGTTKIFISPRMSPKDASYSDAKREHLADEDSLRITNLITDQDENIQKREMQSLLVTDIPLEAWVAMLKDPDNIFGKSIEVDDPDSALAIMQKHGELVVPEGKLKNGVISLIEEVLPYIKDPHLIRNVKKQLNRFYEDQDEIHGKASIIAKRWLDFEIELADSLHISYATLEVDSFINSMQDHWNEDDLEVINAHRIDDSARHEMSRQLAVIVENAKRNFLWTRSAVINDNESVLKQLNPAAIEVIKQHEAAIMRTGNYSALQAIEMRMDRVIAVHNVKVGGGCPGTNNANFKDPFNPNNAMDENEGDSIDSEESRIGKKKKSRCVVKNCPTKPSEVVVGGCGVCLERCQKLFDDGKDPEKTYSHDIIDQDNNKNKSDTHEFSLAG